MLPTSPQPLSGDYFPSSYPEICLGPKMPKYFNLTPRPPELKFLISFIFNRIVSLICFQRALNHYLKIILRQVIQRNVSWAQNAQIGNLISSPPKLKFLISFNSNRSVSLLCFKWALNHYLKIILRQVILRNMSWAQNAQIF